MDVLSERLFSHDPISRITRTFVDNNDGSFSIHARQDATEIVEQNIRDANNGVGRKGDLRLAARVPLIELEELVKAQILSPGLAILDQKKFKQWMNDRDNRKLRVGGGHL